MGKTTAVSVATVRKKERKKKLPDKKNNERKKEQKTHTPSIFMLASTVPLCALVLMVLEPRDLKVDLVGIW